MVMCATTVRCRENKRNMVLVGITRVTRANIYKIIRCKVEMNDEATWTQLCSWNVVL